MSPVCTALLPAPVGDVHTSVDIVKRPWCLYGHVRGVVCCYIYSYAAWLWREIYSYVARSVHWYNGACMDMSVHLHMYGCNNQTFTFIHKWLVCSGSRQNTVSFVFCLLW